MCLEVTHATVDSSLGIASPLDADQIWGFLSGSGEPPPGVVVAAPSQAGLPIWRGQQH